MHSGGCHDCHYCTKKLETQVRSPLQLLVVCFSPRRSTLSA
jgi:hypothetical protein